MKVATHSLADPHNTRDILFYKRYPVGPYTIKSMGDKAQYFLEQSLPELLDLKEKKIFSPLEIKAITRKRIVFEQALTRKIVRKTDFLSYAEYEMNLEALRKQRVKRMKIKGKQTISDWAGPRRIFFIFERALRRFQGDVDLWLQYIDYAKRQKSDKVLGRAYASMLQFHPTRPDLWSMAAKHEMDWNGNMAAARALMQRGLRLNKSSSQLWVNYFEIELEYLEKIYQRRKLLKLDQTAQEVQEEEQITGFEEGDSIQVPEMEMETNDQASAALLKDVELSTLSTARDNPALRGGIPKAILRAATATKTDSAHLPLLLHDCITQHDSLPCYQELLDSIHDFLDHESASTSFAFHKIILPLHRIKGDVSDEAFPAAFAESLRLYDLTPAEVRLSGELTDKWIAYLFSLLARPDLEKHLSKAIKLSITKTFKSIQPSMAQYATWISYERKYGDDMATVLAAARMAFPGFEHFER